MKYESIVNIDAPNEIRNDVFCMLTQKNYIIYEEKQELWNRDKFLIASQIKVNLMKNKDDGLSRIYDKDLQELSKQWLKLYLK